MKHGVAWKTCFRMIVNAGQEVEGGQADSVEFFFPSLRKKQHDRLSAPF